MTASAPPGRRIRVLIVDDSLFMRAAIARALAGGPFDVVGQAKDGHDALAQIARLQPDVITMDFNMPGMTGADTVRQVMQQRPTPVVMFSAHTRQGARETFDALAAGAVDFLTKPDGEVSVDLSRIADELIRKLIAAATARPRIAQAPAAVRASSSLAGLRASSSWPALSASAPGTLPRLCVIGVSTGGPAALSELVPALPADLRVAVVVVQHMPAGFTGPFAERLDAASKVSVHEAGDGDRPQPGSVLIAPGDRHLEFDDRGLVVLTDGPLVNGCRPAADVTMMSAARAYGRRALAIVMTGMGRDGAAGALAIKHADGKTLAQDQATSVIYGMPRAAIDAGAIDEVAPLGDIAAWLRYA
ncbi:MAG TPA: chemotaxis response regulator protein-glutamate methylesterase [Kofleriaceae bacterium]